MNSIAIIGGGITGLTAAFELRGRGWNVTLYEASARVGGPIQTVLQEGYLAECGPNTILETSPKITQLIRDAGLEGHKQYSNSAAANRYIARNRRPVPLPGSLTEFLRTPLFSPGAKARLLAEPFIPRASCDFEESIGGFVMRRLGREFLDYAINPLVAGVYAGDPARLSLPHGFPKLHALEQRYGSLILGQIFGARARRRSGGVSKQNAPKFSFDCGLEMLPAALAGHLRGRVRLEHRIEELQRTETGWEVCGTSRNETFRAQHSAVLLAVPAHTLAALQINGTRGPDLAALSQIEYPPVASVVLGFRREDVLHPLDGFGVLIPEIERMFILGTIFSSSLFPRRAPENHVTLTSYVGGARSPDNALATEEMLIERTLADLRELFGIRGKPSFVHFHLFQKAIPQYNVGFGAYKKLMASLELAAPGLYIGGQARSGIALGDSIQSGFDLAEKAHGYVSSADAALSRPLSPFCV